MIDTGQGTLTGGRVLRVRELLGDSPFLLTYGDGVSDIDLNDLVKFHEEHDGVMTMSSVKPFGRFGTFEKGENGRVARFSEKPKGDGGSINGGFFVCEPDLFECLVDGDLTVLEKGPMETLALEGKLFFYEHQGFWKCMDTLKDKQELDEIYASGDAPWVTWTR